MRLPPFELVDWFAAAEGRFDISLSHSDCEPLNVSDLLDERQLVAFTDTRLGYGQFAGLDELRSLVADQYETLDQNDVLICNGASEAIYTFMRTNLDAGDEIVAASPMFHTLHAIARSMDCTVRDWRWSEATCAFDVSALESLCGANTKLIVFNFPHNPSGQTITESDLLRIVEIARRHDAMILSDEQFRQLELPSLPTLPAACDLYDRAISVTGVSKTHGLGGLRLGWLATRHSETIAAAQEYRYYTTEMANIPSQLLACRALERGEDILSRNRLRIARHVEQLQSFVEQHHKLLRLHVPLAGTMAVLEQKTAMTGSQLCERLLNEARVFLLPGEAMGLSDRFLRVGFGRDDFAEGLERLGSFLSHESL